MSALFNVTASKKRKSHINALQAAQLQDCTKVEGNTIKVGQTPKSLNKGYRDTPLFDASKEQISLF